MKHKTIATFALIALLAIFGAAGAGAHQATSSDLLLPYFEVDLSGSGLTTFFAVVNSSPDPVRIRIGVFTNWGVEVLTSSVELEGDEVKTIDLTNWVVNGQLPDRTLTAEELEHCQAALTGERSPTDELFYSSELVFQKAVGFVTIHVEGVPRPDVIFGDYFVVDPSEDFAQGEVLIDIDPAIDCSNLCIRHGLRFLLGGGFDDGTQVLIWTGLEGAPSDDGVYPKDEMTGADIQVFRQDGELIEERHVDLLPLEVMTVAELGLSTNFGWLDITTDRRTFMAVRHSAQNRFSVALQTFCLPKRQGPPPPHSGPDASIRIEKSTNGADADRPPGPAIAVGEAVLWEYVVTNTGTTPLHDIEVTDDQGVAVDCPEDALGAGDSMVCTGTGTAVAGQYANVGTATGLGPNSVPVEDSDPSHYHGENPGEPAIDIEKATNGEDADDENSGPILDEGDPVEWTYVVTNTGGTPLDQITVTDDQGVAVTCPGTQLDPGESMTCTGHGTAIDGRYSNIGSVVGRAPSGQQVDDSDPSHYTGRNTIEPGDPDIGIEKATNGEDADHAPGPAIEEGDPVEWTYVVTNTGAVPLVSITVTDDQGVAVSCPASQLGPGESMTCTGHGTAIRGQYRNVGSVSGQSLAGQTVTDSDPSHYFGDGETPMISIEKATNGHDADSAPGPSIDEGDAVTWTYVVTNTGDVTLTSVAVSDDQGVSVSCPKATLAPGESMTCTGHGTATAGQYRNVGTASGESPRGTPVEDEDPSHYFGESAGPQGCTPGYWKNHLDSWPPTGYSPGQSVASVFGAAAGYPGIGSASLADALDFGGGSGVEGAARNLLRAAVAAVLNASHPGVSYPGQLGLILSGVDQALAGGDRDDMLNLAANLDFDNNSGCPLN